MSILIVDSHPATRQQCFDMFKLLDSRRRIDVAADIKSGTALAVKRESAVIVCDPVLQDGCGIAFCTELKRELKWARFAAYGGLPAEFQDQQRMFPFDFILDKPVKRWAAIALLWEAEAIGRALRRLRPEASEPRKIAYTHDLNDKSRYCCVTTCLSEDKLRFEVSIPRNSTIQGLIAHLGKAGCRALELRRGNSVVDFTDESILADGDFIVLTTEASHGSPPMLAEPSRTGKAVAATFPDFDFKKASDTLVQASFMLNSACDMVAKARKLASITSASLTALRERLDDLLQQVLEGKSVLLVDDCPDICDLNTSLLLPYRARVHAARTTAEAITLMKSENFNILISNLGLPDNHGKSLVQHIRARESPNGFRLPAIALTGLADETSRLDSLNAGFDAVITKPYNLNELLLEIGRLLAS